MIPFRLSPFVFSLLLFPAFSAVNASALDVQDTSATAPDTAVAPARRVSPRGAAFRSMALPGWGQFCNGKPVKGGVMAAAYAASLTGIVVRQRQLNREQADPAQPRRNVFVFTTLGLLFYSAVDAYVDAHLIREDESGITVNATPHNGIAVRLTFIIRRGKHP